MGWKWWTTTYFKVLFSRDLWLSPFFVVLEVLMVLGVFNEKSPFHENPMLHVGFCIAALLAIAAALTTGGLIQAYSTHVAREKFRTEREAREREFQERISRPPEPKVSPWFLGSWEHYLNKGE